METTVCEQRADDQGKDDTKSAKPFLRLKPGQIVTDEELHSAMEYLRNSAHEVGKWRKRSRECEHMLKVTEALEYKISDGKNESSRKADARTSARYQQWAMDDAEAAGESAKVYALREAASAVVEVWRSQSATLRAATKL
jgi:hypothetical protein